MKRFPKLIVTLVVLAMAIGIFAAMPVAAADYTAVRLKPTIMTVGHYTSLDMKGEIIKHSANSNYNHEVGCMIDNKNDGGYWSKPYKFKDFKDEGGSIVPVILIDLASDNKGEGVKIAGYDMRLRHYYDCMPIHFELQATLSPDSNTWTSIIEKDNLAWETINLRFEFPEVTVYKVRILFYNIDQADVARDTDYCGEVNYKQLLGDETRFTLAEIDLLQLAEGGSEGGSNGGSTTKPTQGSTRPTGGINLGGFGGATQPATPAPTDPTQGATQKPTTQATTQPATGNTGATQPATQAPTTNVTTTEPTGVAPTEPTVDPSAPTETVDPSAPTDVTEPDGTVDATEPEATTGATEPEATTGATEPEATTPTTDNEGGEEEKSNLGLIIGIAAAVVVAGVVVFFIIKKKRA